MAGGSTHLPLLRQFQDQPCTKWRAHAFLVFWLPFLLQRQDRYSRGLQRDAIFSAAKNGGTQWG